MLNTEKENFTIESIPSIHLFTFLSQHRFNLFIFCDTFKIIEFFSIIFNSRSIMSSTEYDPYTEKK